MKKVTPYPVPKICPPKKRRQSFCPFLPRQTILNSGAGGVGKAPCTGDDGAPLVCRTITNGQSQYVQLGIASWGLGCENPHRFSSAAYTNVPKYIEFIKNKIWK